MLNYIWAGMIIISFVVATFTGNMENTIKALTDNAKAGVDICISLMGMMCFWCGIMEIADVSGCVEKLTGFIKPVFKILFKNIPDNHPAISAIFMNISANILGLGNASTPLGIKAMQELQQLNKDKTVATDDMCMFVTLNTASLQLIPTSVIAIRSAFGSVNPTNVIPYIWIGSICSCITVIILCKLMKTKGKKL